MYRTEYDPKFRLNYELEHFIEIGNRFDQRDIPQKSKRYFSVCFSVQSMRYSL